MRDVLWRWGRCSSWVLLLEKSNNLHLWEVELWSKIGKVIRRMTLHWFITLGLCEWGKGESAALLAPPFGIINMWNELSYITMGPRFNYWKGIAAIWQSLMAALMSLFLDEAEGYTIKDFRPISCLMGCINFCWSSWFVVDEISWEIGVLIMWMLSNLE